MAKIKRRGAPPSRWYQNEGKDLAEERGLYDRDADPEARASFLARARALSVIKLRGDVKILREYVRGFEPGAGYDLNTIPQWSAAQVRHVRQYSDYFNHLLSAKKKRVVPRGERQEDALRLFTGQGLDRQYAYAVPVESDSDQVKVKGDRVEIVRRFVTGEGSRGPKRVIETTITESFYFFLPLVGERPQTWDDLIRLTQEILPFLPDEGDYFFYSGFYGEIDVAQPKDSLVKVAQRMSREYGTGKWAHTILGFRRMQTEVEGEIRYETVLKQRREKKAKRRRAYSSLVGKVGRKVSPRRKK